MKKNLKQLRKGTELLLLTFLMLSLTCLCLAQFAGGEGTEEAPWQVATAEHLNNVRNYLGEEHNDKFFIQTANIDLTEATREGGEYWNEGIGWIPIGHVVLDEENQIAEDHRFYGNYNGNRHSISGLFINCVEPDDATIDNRGLFGWTVNAAISYLSLTSIDITGRTNIGALAGRIDGTVVLNCSAQGTVTGTLNVTGGLIGRIDLESRLENSSSRCRLSGVANVGGLAGINYNGSVMINCYSTENVTGTANQIGGLVGYNRYEGSIIDFCYSTGLVTGNTVADGDPIPDPANSRNVGGLVGYNNNSAVISNSYSTGNVTAYQHVGGLVGYNANGSHILSCFATGNATARSLVGGLVGIHRHAGSLIKNCYARGNATGAQNSPPQWPGYSGGLVGQFRGEGDRIENSYATGAPTGRWYPGGLVGQIVSDDWSVLNNYWDTVTSGTTRATGTTGANHQNTATGRTTAQMTFPYDANTFIGWGVDNPDVNENIWMADIDGEVNDGYPFLFFQGIFNYPRTASNPQPEHQATGIGLDLEELSWNYTHQEQYELPLGFRIYFNTTDEFDNEDFEWVVYNENEENYDNSDILPELDSATTYYWQVIPTTRANGTGEGEDARNCPVWSFTTRFEAGSGTEADPYQISTADQLHSIRTFLGEENNDKFFIQTANIDLNVAPYNTDEGWLPIGHIVFTVEDGVPTITEHHPFMGNYNGNGHTINGLFINRDDDQLSEQTILYQGLFGYTDGATIRNLSLTNVNVRGHSLPPRNDERTGALVGLSLNTTIDNCYSSGTVRGGSFVGGLVGRNTDGAILNSHSLCNIVGAGVLFGGIAGHNNAVIRNSYYNFEEVEINEEHHITTGALYAEQYNEWLDNEREWAIGEYLNREGDDYLITNVADLKMLLAFGQFEEYSFLLTGNINLQEETGFYIPYFRGDFDGGDNTISNLNVEIEFKNDVGLFGKMKNNTIADLNLTGVNISSRANVGGLAGLMEGSTVTNCSIQGVVVGNSNQIGGLIGRSDLESTIEDSNSSANVTGASNVGGLAGISYTGSMIDNCYSTGRVTATVRYAGGLVGRSHSGSIIDRSYSTGRVSGRSSGGLVGYLSGLNDPDATPSVIRNSYSTGNVSCNFVGQSFSGGLVGYSRYYSRISDSYSTGNVTGGANTQYVGGFIGYTRSSVRIDRCYSTGNVTGLDYVGGFTARFNEGGRYQNNYSTGNVTGRNFVGGFAGNISNGTTAPHTTVTFRRNYSTGQVTGQGAQTGGFLGHLTSGSLSNNYWNTETSGMTTSSGGANVTGRTVAQMVQQENFAGLDFDTIWDIDEGNSYPFLRWQGEEPGNHNLPRLLPPRNLTARGGITIMDLFWTAPNPDFGVPAGYNVYRGGVLVSELVQGTRFTDRGLNHWTSYSYYLTAVYGEGDEAEESDRSNIASASTHRYERGTGVAGDPFIVETIEQLDGVRNNLTAHYLQNADIDLAGRNWTRIGEGTGDNSFRGTYDGANFEIRNMRAEGGGGTFYRGLFGHTQAGAVLRNIRVVNMAYSCSHAGGGLVGYPRDTRIENCSATGTLTTTGNWAFGGLVGYSLGNTSITNSWADVNITGGHYRIGGLVGYHNSTGVISGCFALGNISSTSTTTNVQLGGLVGLMQNGSIDNCYARGNVTSTQNRAQVGGLIGDNRRAVTDSYSTGRVSSTGGSVGGLIGAHSGVAVSNSYWDTENSGRPTSAGGAGAMGRTTEQMTHPYDPETFVRWSEDIWTVDINNINDGYPILAHQIVITDLDTPVVHIKTIVIEEVDYVKLEWAEVDNANSYKIYASADPSLPFGQWEEIDIVGELYYQEPIDTEENRIMFYRVVASTAPVPDARSGRSRKSRERDVQK